MNRRTKPILPSSFTVDDLPGEWFIRCDRCLAAWTLPKGAPFSRVHQVDKISAHPTPSCHELRLVTDL